MKKRIYNTKYGVFYTIEVKDSENENFSEVLLGILLGLLSGLIILAILISL